MIFHHRQTECAVIGAAPRSFSFTPPLRNSFLVPASILFSRRAKPTQVRCLAPKYDSLERITRATGKDTGSPNCRIAPNLADHVGRASQPVRTGKETRPTRDNFAPE